MRALLVFLLALADVIACPAIAQEAATKAPTVLGPKVIRQTTSVINTDTGPAKYRYPLKYDNVTLKDYDVTTSHYGVNIKDGSHMTVDGGTWRHNGSPEKISANFAVGGGALTLRNVTAIGSYDPTKNVKTEFPNVDNVMAAQRTSLTIIGGTFRDAWESAIDTKGDTKLSGTITCINTARCLKAWSAVVGQPDSVLISIGSRDGDVSCLKSPVVLCNVFLPMLKVRNTNPNGVLVGFQGPGTVHIAACQLEVPDTYRVTWAKAGVKGQTLILGPTCAKNGKVVVYVPPKAPTPAVPAPQIVDAGQLLPDGKPDGLIKLGSIWARKLGLKVNTVVRHLDGFRYQVVP